MTSSQSPDDATFALDRRSGVAVYRQIYDRARAAIADGRLLPGARLPSARNLAAQLGAARGTVDAAYAMLAGEGWIVRRGPAGTVVAPQLAPGQRAAPAAAMPVPGHSSGVFATDMPVAPFRMGLPALDAFPRKLWARLVAREVRALSPAAMNYPDPAGWPPLREAIAAYLGIARGIACTPAQIIVTGGYQGALALIGRTLIEPGDGVWFEDPGYYQARLGLLAAGARLLPLAVDAQGMCVEDGVVRAPQAAFAVVTPAHHSPLGVTLSLPRRLALLSWAAAARAWVVEDDYDGEFHYAGRPLPALKSLDRDDVVLYAGSFSKVLFPALRLGYLVVPQNLVERFVRAAHACDAGQSRLEQGVVAAFMAEGHFARHLNRMRRLYAARRAALAAALATVFGERLRVELQGGGMHLLGRPAGDASDDELVRLAMAEGLMPGALSLHRVARDPGAGLLLSFTNIAENHAEGAAQALLRAIGDRLPPG